MVAAESAGEAPTCQSQWDWCSEEEERSPGIPPHPGAGAQTAHPLGPREKTRLRGAGRVTY